ncbi:hypothetical protein [Novosphingobium sp. 9]|uniref:hypothetical protein n=1 Tax=Novosphingobium sp. 9 TaxID=2025349 RepID=UPI0021B4F547|nr:hypothetical protein [Novosphingobium sp. 9]
MIERQESSAVGGQGKAACRERRQSFAGSGSGPLPVPASLPANVGDLRKSPEKANRAAVLTV